MRRRHAAWSATTLTPLDSESYSPAPLLQATLWGLGAFSIVLYSAPIVLPWLEGAAAMPAWLCQLR
jgi:hypothetical protein